MGSVFFSLFLIVGAGVFLIVGAVTTLGLLVLAGYWAHCGWCLARDKAVHARGRFCAWRRVLVARRHVRRDAAAFGVTEEGC